jgi:hypothetical protein
MANNPLNNHFVARATLDIADTGTISAGTVWNSGVWIPEGAICTRAFYYVTTTFTDGGDDNSVVEIGLTSDDDCILTAALGVISDATSTNMNGVATGNLDAGLHVGLMGVPALGADAAHSDAVEVAGLSAALMQITTANQEIIVTVATDVLSAGKMDIYVEYFLTGDLT